MGHRVYAEFVESKGSLGSATDSQICNDQEQIYCEVLNCLR